MLNDLLNNLPGLLSRRFLLTGLLPLSLFLFANAMMLYMYTNWGQSLYPALHVLDGGKFWITTTLSGLTLILSTFIYDGLIRGASRWLEGAGFWAWLRNWALADRQAKFLAAERELNFYRTERRQIDVDDFKRRMREARSNGARALCTYPNKHKTRMLIKALEKREFAKEPLSASDLNQVVVAMVDTLSKNNADMSSNADSNRLDADHVRLVRIIDTASDRHSSRIQEANLALQRNFPLNPAATKFGRVAATINSYAFSRYKMMDLLWPRLQRVMQSDDTFYTTLQEAKTRVDFFVSLLVVTSLFTLVWLVTLGMLGHEPIVILLIGTFGPVLCWFWYGMATSSNRVFAELAHSGVDLHRLSLLEQLKIKQPSSLSEERTIWVGISRHVAYGEPHTLDYTDDA